MSPKAASKSAKKASTKKEASEEKTTETPAAAEPSTSVPSKNLYEKEVERYRTFLKRGFDTAYKVYGFTLFHSLPPEEKVSLLHELGFEPKNPEDFYNLGCLAAQQGDFATASEYFQKTIELAADFEEAYYNLALVQENLGDENSAVKNWEIYVEFLDEDSSETVMVSEHIVELKAQIAEKKKKKKKK